jgi:hypothetical protein
MGWHSAMQFKHTISTMRANDLMKHNVVALLKGRRQTQRDLAQWCRRSDAWIGKILKEERREFPMKYWDRIADFFGVSVYQLIQPGISAVTERRRRDRRSGLERRLRNIAGEPHRAAISDQSLIREVLNLGADDRIELVRLLAQTKRRGIDVPSTAGTTPGPDSSSPPSAGARASQRPRLMRPQK